jgi:peptidoglycan/xylan/chitin deacetylase (PgdA/CDA1 family)
MYHVVCPIPAEADPEESSLVVRPDRFAWQMADLAARGFQTLRLDQYWQVVVSAAPRPRSVLLTFDDAYAHIDRTVTPILMRHGFTAVMFAAPAHLGERNTWDGNHRFLSSLEVATADQLAAMAAGSCWELASHALRHVDLCDLSPAERRAELVESRERLSMLAKRPVRDLAYPFGRHDAAVREDVRLSGYRMAFTAGRGALADLHQLPRRPVRGQDRAMLFGLKTSAGSRWIYDGSTWPRRRRAS